jgi:hypothetical protein
MKVLRLIALLGITCASQAQETRGTIACCMPDDPICYDFLSPMECEANGGTVMGPPSECLADPCNGSGGATEVACCVPGNETCIDTLDEEGCLAQGGTVVDTNPMACLSQPCAPKGACCFGNDMEGYSCEVYTESSCLASGGSFKGVNQGCADYVCTTDRTGCCVNDGCVLLYEVDCTSIDGTVSDCDACEPVQETCSGDLNGNGVVDMDDLLILIGAWGACP